MDSANQSQSPPAAGAAGVSTPNRDTQNQPQSFFVEAQGSLSPYPLQSKDQSPGYPSPVSNQADEAQRTQYGGQYDTAGSPQVSNPTWMSTQQPSYTGSDAPAHPDLSNRPDGMTPREAAEKRENDILNGAGSQTYSTQAAYTPSPAQADLSNRPAGMTPREAAEKREAAILGAAGNSSRNPPAVPAGHVVPLIALREKAMPVDCPGCQRMVTTRVDKHVSERGTMWSVVICLCLGVLCFWIPLVMDEFKEYEHRCPNCHIVLAAVDSDGRVTHVYNQLPGPHPSNHIQPQYSQHQQQQQQQQQQPQQSEQKQEYGVVQERPIELRNENSIREQIPTSPQEVPADASTEVRKEREQQPTEVFELPGSTAGSKKSKKGFFGKKK